MRLGTRALSRASSKNQRSFGSDIVFDRLFILGNGGMGEAKYVQLFMTSSSTAFTSRFAVTWLSFVTTGHCDSVVPQKALSSFFRVPFLFFGGDPI